MRLSTTSYVGGAPADMEVVDLTRGHFESGFVGCVRDIVVQRDPVSLELGDGDGGEDGKRPAISGHNVDDCGMRRR